MSFFLTSKILLVFQFRMKMCNIKVPFYRCKRHFQWIIFHTTMTHSHQSHCKIIKSSSSSIALTSAGSRVKSGSLHVSDSAVARVLNELNYLRSNHSDVMEAEADARSALESVKKNHEKLKVQIDEKKAANDNYQRQVEDLLGQKLSLQANLSAFGKPQSTQRQPVHWEFQNKITDSHSFIFPRGPMSGLPIWMDCLQFILLLFFLLRIPSEEELAWQQDRLHQSQLGPDCSRLPSRAGVFGGKWDFRDTSKNLNLPTIENFSPSLLLLVICERQYWEHGNRFLDRPQWLSDWGPVGLG